MTSLYVVVFLTSGMYVCTYGVKLGDVIRLESLQMPPNVTPTASVPLDFVICVVKTE